jgi:2,3-bisphosphoglycerate-dependent phosphoglycerate mutase
MTVVYFVRHAESDKSRGDERTRGLSARGIRDRELVTRYLADKEIQAAFSSPYRRAVETIDDFADKQGMTVRTVDGLREWDRCADPSVDFTEFCRRHWEDHEYRYADGESLRQVQMRNIAALENILGECEDKNVIIGTHGMALSTVISYYDPDFGYDAFEELLPRMPLIVRMVFDGKRCAEMETIGIEQMREGR